jgi:hypothetical protein
MVGAPFYQPFDEVKAESLPAPPYLRANTVYYVSNPAEIGLMTIYVSNGNGTAARRAFNREDAIALLAAQNTNAINFAITSHKSEAEPHMVYDSMPDLTLIFEGQLI